MYCLDNACFSNDILWGLKFLALAHSFAEDRTILRARNKAYNNFLAAGFRKEFAFELAYC